MPARRPAATDTPADAGAHHHETAIKVLRQFRLVFNTVKAHFQQVEKQVGVGGAQVWALSVVRDQPGIGVGDLAKAMDIHQSTASNLVKALVERGLLATEKGTADRRAVQLRLLPPGARLLKQVPGPFAGILPSALEQLDDASLARLHKDLAKLIALLDAHDKRASRIPLAGL
jgi:DNA-binding MarR family transcriptional regulator